MNPSQVLDVLARLEVAYRTEVTDPERNLWLEELAPFDAQLVAAAAEDRIRSESPFMPKVGEIIAACREALAEVGSRPRLELPAGEYVDMPQEIAEKLHEIGARTESAEERWERVKAEAERAPRPPGFCSGVGRYAVRDESGAWVCPSCGGRVEDGCSPSRDKNRARA